MSRGFSHKAIANLFSVGVLSFLLSGCASENSGTFFDAVVAPDPQLQQELNGGAPAPSGSLSQECSASILSQLPNTFPAALCYPDALFLGTESLTDSRQTEGRVEAEGAAAPFPTGQLLKTQWSTNQPLATVQRFYQNFFDAQEWQVTRLPNELAGAGLFQAVKGHFRITIRFLNVSQLSDQSSERPRDLISISKVQPLQYTLEYRESVAFEGDSPSVGRLGESNALPTASDQRLGVEGARLREAPADVEETDKESSERAEADPETVNDTLNETGEPHDTQPLDLNDVPDELRDYVEAGIELGSVAIEANIIDSEREEGESLLATFRPNDTITRRLFARWLVQANNRLYEQQPYKQIRLASPLSEPAFEDVRPTDPDFRVIQGLAETGLIPSPLSSDTGTENTLFRGDAPLTRETLVAWKIPLDVHKGLAVATVETIQETWGFQDATKITPSALSAIAADYQNGDRANLRRAFGYTLLFQPQKSVTRAEAAAALWYFGTEKDGISATDLLENQSAND